MAKRERVETDTICDRPGCGRRVTDKGGAALMTDHALLFVDKAAENTDHVDLCRECRGQMASAWYRKSDEAAKA
jgi:hypothetical protein